MAKELIMGIDDAGRGPIIGPMFLAGVLVKNEQNGLLKDGGVKDSKMLTHASRVRLAKLIEEHSLKHKVVSSFPDEIDAFVESKSNLNTLEATKTAEIINFLNDETSAITVVIDCPSVNISAWRNTVLRLVKHPDNLNIVCEHKADVNHPSVSAASILAKVAREDAVAKIRKQFYEYGDVGSGYPADPTTKEFLKKHGLELENSGIFRKSWSTWKNMFKSDKTHKQETLEL